MTVSLSVADVLRLPATLRRDRVVVTGVIHLDEQLGFRIFQGMGADYDRDVFLEIDDPDAAAKVRAALVGAGYGPAYLGRGLVDGRGRATERGLLVEEVLTVHVGDPFDRAAGFLAIDVRPNPYVR